MTKTIKFLASMALFIWLALFIKSAMAMNVNNDRYLIEQILIEMCDYAPSVCGYMPSVAPPPRKPV